MIGSITAYKSKLCTEYFSILQSFTKDSYFDTVR